MGSTAIEDAPLILVTGASGFIAVHLIKQLQTEGYRVRGTVRSLSNEQKIKPLKELCPDAKYPLELVEADLTKPDSWYSAVAGCTYVMHLASPFPTKNPKNEDEVIKPAVEGTTSVLKACHKTKVKRVVLTSSTAAVSGAWGETGGKVYTESDWSDITKVQTYEKSKTLAERAAWQFVESLPEEEKFELAVVNPSLSLGPVLSGCFCTSMEIPRKLLLREMPAVPRLFIQMVDVRDVVAAHIKAMTVPEAAGHRHLISSSGKWMLDMARIIAKEFNPQGYKVPTTHCPYALAYINGLWDDTVKMLLPAIGKTSEIDNSRTKNILGVNIRPIDDTIIEMCYSMIESGFIKKTKQYTGPQETVPESTVNSKTCTYL